MATVTWWAAVIDRRRALLPLYAVEIAGLVTLHELAAGLVLAHVIAAAIMRVDSSPGPNPPGHPRGRRVANTVATAGAGLLVAAPLTVLAVDNGHGATRFASFSLFHLGAAAASDAVELQAYDPRDDSRLIDVVPQADLASIWPTRREPSVVRERLRLLRRIIVLERRDRALPGSILADGYHVATTLPSGGGWTAYVAVRPT